MIHSITQWDQWLSQAEQDATASNREMALVIKYNNVDTIVLLHKPIDNLHHNRYKQYFIHLFDQWLAQEDEHFFTVIV